MNNTLYLVTGDKAIQYIPEDPAIGETTKTVIDIIKGEMPMGMDGSFNLCDVRDLAAGTIAAADKGKKGECITLLEITLLTIQKLREN